MTRESGRPICITVFAASSMGGDARMLQAIESLLQRCLHFGVTIKFGGANVGLMGALAERAQSKGVETVGVLPSFLSNVEPASPSCSRVVIVESMAERKAHLMDADGLCILPGGFGTLDESFEAITLKQLGKTNIPIALVNVDDYFADLLKFIDSCVEHGSIVLQGRDTFRVFDHPNLAVDCLCS